jgi:hypothetical protein
MMNKRFCTVVEQEVTHDAVNAACAASRTLRGSPGGWPDGSHGSSGIT